MGKKLKHIFIVEASDSVNTNSPLAFIVADCTDIPSFPLQTFIEVLTAVEPVPVVNVIFVPDGALFQNGGHALPIPRRTGDGGGAL